MADHIVCLVDARANMFEEGHSQFSVALRIIHRVLKTKIVNSDKNMVGVTLFGTANKSSPDCPHDHIFDLIPLGRRCIRGASAVHLRRICFPLFAFVCSVMPAARIDVSNPCFVRPKTLVEPHHQKKSLKCSPGKLFAPHRMLFWPIFSWGSKADT